MRNYRIKFKTKNQKHDKFTSIGYFNIKLQNVNNMKKNYEIQFHNHYIPLLALALILQNILSILSYDYKNH